MYGGYPGWGGINAFTPLLVAKALGLPPVGNLYISIHPCRSVCDCSGVTAAADVMNIFVSLQKAPTVGPPALFANSPAVGLRCSLSTTNETLWQRNFCNFCYQTVMNNLEGIFDDHIWKLISYNYKSIKLFFGTKLQCIALIWNNFAHCKSSNRKSLTPFGTNLHFLRHQERWRWLSNLWRWPIAIKAIRVVLTDDECAELGYKSPHKVWQRTKGQEFPRMQEIRECPLEMWEWPSNTSK